MNARTTLRRVVSQTDPTTGVDPYNTADKLRQDAARALDFVAWLETLPKTGDENGNTRNS